MRVPCGTCAMGAIAKVGLDLSDPSVLLELKSLMSLIAPSLIKDESWFQAPWSAADWEGYKAIVAKLPGSAEQKKKLLAYVSGNAVVLGMPPSGTVGFPSIWGIQATGDRLIQQQVMTAESLETAFPTLALAGKTAPSLPAGSAGVLPPSGPASSGKGVSPYLIAAGVGVLLVGGYFLLRKKK